MFKKFFILFRIRVLKNILYSNHTSCQLSQGTTIHIYCGYFLHQRFLIPKLFFFKARNIILFLNYKFIERIILKNFYKKKREKIQNSC